MGDQNLSKNPPIDHCSNVDTSSPFSSVKEAVAVFGERLLVGELYSPKPYFSSPKPDTPRSFSTPSPSKLLPREEADDEQHSLTDSLKKLEAELAETKRELKLLKERETETEVALASLNAELHKNMSRLAQAEAAAAAAKAAATRRPADFGRGNGEDAIKEQEKIRDMMVRMESSPTLAQILSISEKKVYSESMKEKKTIKKKPIVPLVGDLFRRKKTSPTTDLHNTLYSSPHFFN